MLNRLQQDLVRFYVEVRDVPNPAGYTKGCDALRLAAKARNLALRRHSVLPPLAEHNTDTIVYRNYID